MLQESIKVSLIVGSVELLIFLFLTRSSLMPILPITHILRAVLTNSPNSCHLSFSLPSSMRLTMTIRRGLHRLH
jgi:hypothetical protein